MNAPAALSAPATAPPLTQSEILQLGQEIICTEARALAQMMHKLDASFYQAVELLFGLEGSLIVTGMGKAGHIGQKLSATFASTGTRSHFLHPAEAFHGDLGRVGRDDVVLLFSQSGETEEVTQLLPTLSRIGATLIAVTASSQSTLGRSANVVIELGKINEACFHGLAPTTSTTVMLALGDALALVVSRLKGFAAEDFAQFHPGGALGQKLSHVEDHMRPLEECRMTDANATVREVLVDCTKPGRRTGAIMLTDASGKLSGLFTDSDLVRLIESRNESALDRPVGETMITSPTTVTLGDKMSKAVEILAQRKISELPVLDADGKPAGLIDVTDVVGLLPETTEETSEAPATPQVRLFKAEN